MPDPKLLWFLSTDRGRSYYIEGQRFDPDDDGYIAVPENIGLIISRHPELKYVGRAIGLVPLGTVRSDTYRELLMQRVEAEWRAARLLLWGYHGDDRRQCKPIPYPYSLELQLDWVAGPGREDCANPRFPELKYSCHVSAYYRHNPSDFWTELLIAKADLDRLRNMVAAEYAAQTGTPTRNAVPTTLRSTPRVAIGDAIAFVASRRNVSVDDALAEILSRIADGALDPEGIGERGEKIAILPHWSRWLACFGTPPKTPQPEHGILWFDTTQAIGEWRTRRRDLEGRDAEPSRCPLPPSRLRDITVSAVQLDELWPAPIVTSHPAGDLATESSGVSAPVHNDDRRCVSPPEPMQTGKVPSEVLLQKPKDSIGRDARSHGGGSQRRGTYIGELKAFMTRLNPQSLNVLDDDDVAQRFVDYVEARVKRGQSVLKLPQRRHIANQVAKIRAQIAESNAPERQ
jgi:hypothetical protein